MIIMITQEADSSELAVFFVPGYVIPVAYDVIHITCDVISKLCGSGNLLLSGTVLLNTFRNVPVLSTLIITILIIIMYHFGETFTTHCLRQVQYW